MVKGSAAKKVPKDQMILVGGVHDSQNSYQQRSTSQISLTEAKASAL